MGFSINSSLLFILSDHIFNLLIQSLDLLLLRFTLTLQLRYLIRHLRLPLLRHQRFSHPKRNRRLVQTLIRHDRLLDLVSDPDEEESSLGAVDCDLSDELVEALGVELFSDGADAGFSGLSALDSLFELFL